MGGSTAPGSILDLTKSCISKFERILASESTGADKALENRQADFNLWADGVGATAKPGASLDSRLKGRANDLTLVKNVLTMLADSLDYYASLGNDSGEGIQNIDAAIKNLALIGVAIRRTGKASRSRRADRSFDPDAYPEFRAHLECLALLRPAEEGLFRKTDQGHYVNAIDVSKVDDIQKRLIDANLKRRHYFLLAQRRSGARRYDHAPPTTPEVPRTEEPHRKPPEVGDKAGLQASAFVVPGKGKERGAPTISGPSLASTAEGTLQHAPAAKKYTPGTARTQITCIASDAEFPKAPLCLSDREISTCPCCCQSLPAETFRNPRMWRQHVIEDLCPYTCIAENCPTPQLLFCTRDEWEAHVKKTHLPRWQCPFCREQDADHRTIESMGSHLQAEHEDELSVNPLSTLLSWSAVQTMGIRSCPLCASNGPEDSPELVEHVLRHAYEFALRALPWPQPIVQDLNVPPGSFRPPEELKNAEEQEALDLAALARLFRLDQPVCHTSVAGNGKETPKLTAAEKLERWITGAVHESEETPALRLCGFDRADHSAPETTGGSEYSDFFNLNSYFGDRPEDGSSKPQGDRSTPLSNDVDLKDDADLEDDADSKDDINSKDEDGRTLLSRAAENGDAAVVERLLATGKAEVDAKDNDGQTSLHLAAKNGHEAVAKLLADQGADIKAKNRYGWTPLHLVADNGHEAVVRLLAKQGADIEAKSDGGWTPLHLAAENGHEAVVRLLAELGADIEAKINQWTPLHLAATSGHEAVVRLLAELGADIKTKNGGWTPLHSAAGNGHEAVVRLLAELGADIEAENDGWTPLHLAAMNGHEAVARLLVAELGADKEAKNDRGRTPLRLAAERGYDDVARLLE
ncbi:hypothetical protein MAPG_10647 [Magnaporthiopsis poae ATCC 64411]|uniref:Uncharacterized protein n=1 Tax=Magnaporthiopsis poae (strain ATCC 64411 / 73-15) TaxID=644358 RepID=A0A0C4ED54_MAGP6|nr:hypothetical protein MAPG_10647 [Magnaporthiopsis poae ATCC 64411]